MDYRLIRAKHYVIGYCRISGEHSRKREHDAAFELLYTMILEEFGMNPQMWTLTSSEKGKPYFSDADIFFNVSHCHGLAVCAISLECDVGVDVEWIRECRDNTAKRIMSGAEYEMFCLAEDKNRMFFRIWTYKESVLKLTGEGIRSDLRKLDSLHDNSCEVEHYEFGLDGKQFIVSCAIQK